MTDPVVSHYIAKSGHPPSKPGIPKKCLVVGCNNTFLHNAVACYRHSCKKKTVCTGTGVVARGYDFCCTTYCSSPDVECKQFATKLAGVNSDRCAEHARHGCRRSIFTPIGGLCGKEVPHRKVAE